MSILNTYKIDYKGEFSKTIRKTHKVLVEKIEENAGEKLPNSFRRRILLGNNFAYLSFDGKINGQESYFLIWSHSAINGTKRLERFNEFFKEYYCMPKKDNKIPVGAVNEKNDTLVYDENIKDDFDGNPIYIRANDSEAKLIEEFLFRTQGKDIEGDLFFYTTLGPCLSCEMKFKKLIDGFIENMGKVNVEVFYCTDYSDKNFSKG